MGLDLRARDMQRFFVSHCTSDLIDDHYADLEAQVGPFRMQTDYANAQTEVLLGTPANDSEAVFRSFSSSLGRYGRMDYSLRGRDSSKAASNFAPSSKHGGHSVANMDSKASLMARALRALVQCARHWRICS